MKSRHRSSFTRLFNSVELQHHQNNHNRNFHSTFCFCELGLIPRSRNCAARDVAW